VNKVSATLSFKGRPHSFRGENDSAEAAWTPNTDVYLTDTGLVIKVELAGMRREDLDLAVEGQTLRIRGHRHDVCRNARCKFVIMEINYGPFESVIQVPEECDLTDAKAGYQNGFLRIDIPFRKAEPHKPFSVPIDDV
jgi:HSP20 family protein